jgi:group I intron endonuclease
MSIGRVYKISNNFNTQVYIGQTWSTLVKRFKEHVRRAGAPKLHNSISKHGPYNFKIELLWEEECTQAELDAKESYFIAELCTMSPNGYNLKEGGSGGKLSDESRLKMSNSHRGKVVSIETKDKMVISAQCNTNCIGRVLSEKTKRLIGDRNLGDKSHWYGKSGGDHPTSKKVEQWSKDGEQLIRTYSSLTEATNELGADISSLSACCRGKRKTCMSFTWRYASQINS